VSELKVIEASRGFKYVEFEDRNGEPCSLQESGLATDDCIWLGCDEIGLKKFTPYKGWEGVELQQDHPYGITHVANNRMHLNREQVAALLPFLQRFVETGYIFQEEDK